MKQRFTYLDIRTIVNELTPIILNTYIQNIYSPTNKHYILKLSSKHLVLIEPGVRMHLTDTYDNAQTHFNIIARKYLRRNIIKEIVQVGFDRVVKITTNKYIVYVEFYSGGNIVITDFENVIVDLWRTVKEVGIEKGEVYVTNEVELDFSLGMMYKQGVKEMIGLDKQVNEDVARKLDEGLKEIDFCLNKEKNAIVKIESKDNQKDNIDTVKIVNGYKDKNDESIDENTEPEKIYIKSKGVYISSDENVQSNKYEQQNVQNKDKLLSQDDCLQNQKLTSFFDKFMSNIIESFKNTINIATLIYVKGKPNTFLAYKLEGFETLPSLNEALLIYYKKEEKILKSKSNVVKDKQEKRIKDLEDEMTLCDTKVSLMYDNQEKIEQILFAHKSVIDHNLDWKEFEKHKNEQKDLKDLIDKSDFKNQKTVLKIDNTKIECDFMHNFNTNINRIYDYKRKIKEKVEKTTKNIKKVVKMVEKKENKTVKKKTKIERKIYWFERFHYLIYRNKLIIGGKTAQQNDIIVKKYFSPNDLYFHTDTQGASSIILQNGVEHDEDILNVTAHVSLCNSNCWKNKVTSDIFYVNYDQVSKTTESGEYLSTGSFMIRGKKNYVDAFRMEYGIGLMFRKKKEIDDLATLQLKEEDDYRYFVIDPLDAEIEHALVICGPWMVIKNYKYKEKLMPGLVKKGKLVTEIIKRFTLKLKDCQNDSEINSVKNLTHDEFMNVMINNVKIGKQ